MEVTNITPLEQWRLRRGISYAAIASRCRKRGLRAADKYIEQVFRGWYRPSYALARCLSEQAKSEVSVDSIMDFPYSSTNRRTH